MRPSRNVVIGREWVDASGLPAISSSDLRVMLSLFVEVEGAQFACLPFRVCSPFTRAELMRGAVSGASLSCRTFSGAVVIHTTVGDGLNRLGSIKHRAVEAAVLDGFEEVRGLDFFGAREIGDRAGDFENAIVGARGEAELLHRLLQEIAERGIDRAVFADVRVGHAGVGGDFRAGKSLLLP